MVAPLAMAAGQRDGNANGSTSSAALSVQRSVGGHLPTAPAIVAIGATPAVRRSTGSGGESAAVNGSPLPEPAARQDEPLSTTAILDRVDEMMDQLEERILEELERRGGRFAGYF